GERRLPRPADDRRARAPPAREARGGRVAAGVHPHRAQRRLPLPRSVNPLRTVGGRLALALLLVVAGALTIVYVVVVPSYQRSLVNARLADLDHALVSIMQLPRRPDGVLDQAWVEDTAYPLA